MTSVDIISNWLGRLEMWIEDNLGKGDGTELVAKIWKDDPATARKLAAKWTETARRTKISLGTDKNSSEVQKAVLTDFLTSLDEKDQKTFIGYIAEKGRPKA